MQVPSDYFSNVYARLPGETEAWSYTEGTLPSWSREGQCHRNADIWAEHNAQSRAVRGWLVSDQGYGCYVLTAHSLVWDADRERLLDITPPLFDPDRQSMRFLRHLGSEEEFMALLPRYTQVTLP